LSVIDNEKAILAEAPDFDHQIQILEEERKEVVKKRKWYILIASIFLLIVIIFVVSYSKIYYYREYGVIGNKECENVNIKVDGSKVPNINVTEGKDCVPAYNIDYYNNRKATFNIDIFGDRSFLFNKTNQKDETGKYCVLNCDANKDGWPDYNIDLNGDGKADVNIILNPKNNNNSCDINCDINFDTIPDTNIDVDGDNVADVNITDGKTNVPIYNIDYKGNRKATFNIKDGEKVINPVTPIKKGQSCKNNCDIDGDGWPDYNITLTEGGEILNELISEGNKDVVYDESKERDWKCHVSPNLASCKISSPTKNNVYINIDVDGDGVADVNVSDDRGKNLVNEIGKNNMNIDYDQDGFPDYNIDLDNDGKADLNIIESNKYKCIKNCDTNNDGKADYLIDIAADQLVSIYNLNIDVDYDGVCDINCDISYDLSPDISIDIDGDNIADVNIDFDKNNTIDFNVDVDGDYQADENLDAYGNGICTFNCDGQNVVSKEASCVRNCDTNNDGWPDKNVDVDGDYICDFNCNASVDKVDADNNYYLDSDYNSGILDLNESDKEVDFYIMNPLDIQSDGVEPGWEDKYVLKINNNTNYAVKYQIVWENVINEFTDINNLDYNLSRSNTAYLNGMKAPRRGTVLKDNVIIRANSSAAFLMDISFKETGINQNIDSGKRFKGQLIIRVVN